MSANFVTRETPMFKLGFLHNLSLSVPSDDLRLPLKPPAWRGNDESAAVDRIRRPGATQTIVLSDH